MGHNCNFRVTRVRLEVAGAKNKAPPPEVPPNGPGLGA
jgi:hypothetical protein